MIEIDADKSPKIIKKGDFFAIYLNITNGHEEEITVKEIELFYPVGFVPSEVAAKKREFKKEQHYRLFVILLVIFRPWIEFFGFRDELRSYQADFSNKDKAQTSQNDSIGTEPSQSQIGPIICHRRGVKIQPKGSYREDFGFKAGWSGGLRPRPDTYVISGKVTYFLKDKTCYKIKDIEVSIFPSMGTMLVGTLVGSVLGTVVRVFTGGPLPNPPDFLAGGLAGESPNFVTSMATLIFINLILGLLIGIILMRKKDVQPFLTVEDFWGGILLGFLVGYLGIQFLFQFGNLSTSSNVLLNIVGT